MDYLTQLLIVCPLLFFAGFVDSIAGGGGLISLPAFMAAGLPAQMAQGTNKLAASFGTFVSTAGFVKNKQYEKKTAFWQLIGAIVGAFIGTSIATVAPEELIRTGIIISLPVIAYLVLFKIDYDKAEAVAEHEPHSHQKFGAGISGFVLGFYDGLFGPGTGTFLILANISIVGLSLGASLGNTKITNLVSGLSSLVRFLMGGYVVFSLGIPAAVFNMLGNFIGTKLALKNGKKILRPMVLLVLALLLLKLVYDQVLGT